MRKSVEDNQSSVVYIPKFREYGVRILDGGNSLMLISFCPWCGLILPTSLRDAWFSKIEALGMEPDDPKISVEFLTDLWWKMTDS